MSGCPNLVVDEIRVPEGVGRRFRVFLSGLRKWGKLMGAVSAEWIGCRLVGDGKGR